MAICVNNIVAFKDVIPFHKNHCHAFTDEIFLCIIIFHTDLTLRCLSRSLNKDSDCSATVSEPTAVGASLSQQGILIALCCHQRCAWGSFFGREIMSSFGFTPVDFHLITHMTSWGVCGVHPTQQGKTDHETIANQEPVQNPNGKPLTDETIPKTTSPSECPPHHDPSGYHDNGYQPHPKEAIGLKCKRLLDFCRIRQLRQSGYQVQLVYYTQKDVSLENVLLLATTK